MLVKISYNLALVMYTHCLEYNVEYILLNLSTIAIQICTNPSDQEFHALPNKKQYFHHCNEKCNDINNILNREMYMNEYLLCS